MTLVYDGSFESYLCLVHDVYYKKLIPTSIVKEYDALLFDDVHFCVYEPKKAEAVLGALKQKFKKKEFQSILNTFLCDKDAFEMPLLEFIRQGFSSQNELHNINNEAVLYIRSLEKKLFSTYHRYSGFLRFEELSDKTLYAKIDAQYNLLYLLGRHFSKRLHAQEFIIHDIKRELAFLHVNGESSLQQVAEYKTPEVSADERKMQKLWKGFFESVNIKERTNEKLQKSWIPLHYRTYMTEFA